jgi:hypothetical protein
MSHTGDRTHGRRTGHLTQLEVQHHDTTGTRPASTELGDRLGDPVQVEIRLTTEHLHERSAVQGVVFDHSDGDRAHAENSTNNTTAMVTVNHPSSHVSNGPFETKSMA